MALKMTEERINRNYMLWIEYLKTYNCYNEKLIEDLGNNIIVAPWGMDEKSGGACCGGMLEVVINKLCPMATHINKLAFGVNEKGKIRHEKIMVNDNSLLKVLLLQHIAKGQYFVPTQEEWKKKKGTFYDFNGDIKTSLKLGERSAWLCMKYGIELSEEEFEAMRIIDREEKMSIFTTPLSALVRVSNELTNIELYRDNGQ